MPDLLSTQRIMQNYLLKKDRAIDNAIVENEWADRRERLSIYYEMYRLRLSEFLEIDYPVTRCIMGQKLFETNALSYVENHISVSFTAANYSRYFPEYIGKKYRDHPEFSEMAMFELLLYQAAETKDAGQLTRDQLKLVDAAKWAELKFILHPSVKLNRFAYNTLECWVAHSNEEVLPALHFFKQKRPWLLWRVNPDVNFMPITEDEASMFTGFAKEKCFADVCCMLSDTISEDRISHFAGETLAEWIYKGVFTRCEI